jgi:hypothetical protein
MVKKMRIIGRRLVMHHLPLLEQMYALTIFNLELHVNIIVMIMVLREVQRVCMIAIVLKIHKVLIFINPQIVDLLKHQLLKLFHVHPLFQ